MNSILVDFKLFKDWQFPQILSEETGEVWTALECHSNKFYGGKITLYAVSFGFSTIPCRGLFVGEREKK